MAVEWQTTDGDLQFIFDLLHRDKRDVTATNVIAVHSLIQQRRIADSLEKLARDFSDVLIDSDEIGWAVSVRTAKS